MKTRTRKREKEERKIKKKKQEVKNVLFDFVKTGVIISPYPGKS